MLETSRPEVAFGLDVVSRASRLARRIQAEMASSAIEKADRSPVTVADFCVQALVGWHVDRSWPDLPLVAEESSQSLRRAESAAVQEGIVRFLRLELPEVDLEAACRWIDRGGGEPEGRFWVLDPIDGTKGFLRGDQYAVALALVEDGKVRVGFLGCPRWTLPGEDRERGSLLAAVGGGGAWWAPLEGERKWRPLQVSSRTHPSEIRFLRSFESEHIDVGQLERLMQRLGVEREPERMDSQAKYGQLACGAADLLLRVPSPQRPDRREWIWDHAAGSLLVEEAGGQVTDVEGKSLDFSAGRRLNRNFGVLVSNGHLHRTVLEVLHELAAP